MGRRGWLWALIVVGAFAWLTPAVAQACACCGSEEWVQVVGWRRDGKAAVVHHKIYETCNTSEYFEVWEVGHEAPAYCLSAYAEDPTKALDCNKVGGTDPNGAVVDEPKPLVLPAGFQATARALPSEHVLLWAEDDEDNESGVALSLSVFAGRGFSSVSFPKALMPDFFEFVDALSVWPAPRGRAAMVLMMDIQADEEESRVAWVRLPGRIDRAALVEEPQWVSSLYRPRKPDPDEAPPVGRRLAMARVHARAGQLDTAVSLAKGAVNRDPSNPRSWIAYARFLLLDDRVALATELLRALVRLKCAVCSSEVATALSDPVFAPLRGTPGLPKAVQP